MINELDQSRSQSPFYSNSLADIGPKTGIDACILYLGVHRQVEILIKESVGNRVYSQRDHRMLRSSYSL